MLSRLTSDVDDIGHDPAQILSVPVTELTPCVRHVTSSCSKPYYSLNRKAQYSFVIEFCISLELVRLQPTVKSVDVNNWQLYFTLRMVLSMRGFIVIPFQV